MKSIYTKFFSTNALMTLLFLFASTFVFGQSRSSNLSAYANHPEKGKIKLNDKPNSVELTEKRTLKSRTFDNKDGSKTQALYNIPIHYDDNGVLLSIDNNIEINNSGKFTTHSYVNQKNTFINYLSDNLHDGFIVESRSGDIIYDMIDPKMYFLVNNQTVQIQNINNSSINITDEKANYYDVYQGIDLEVTICNKRKKVDYIIKSNSFLNLIPNGAEYLVFEESVQLPNGWAPELTDNTIKLNNQIDENIFTYDIPLISDSPNPNNSLPLRNSLSEDRLNNQDEGLPCADYEISYNSSNNILTILVKVSVDWLSSSDRNFPLIIDPDLVGGPLNDAIYSSNWISGRYQTFTLSGAAPGSTLDNILMTFDMTFDNETAYCNGWGPYDWTDYCGNWFNYKVHKLGSGLSAQFCPNLLSGNIFYLNSNTLFNGEDPNDDYRLELMSLDGYGWAQTPTTEILVSYTEPVSDFTWTGAAGDGNWNTAGNWDVGITPTSSNNCIIPAGGQADIIIGGDCANLTINGSALFNVLAGVTIRVYGNLSDAGGAGGIVEGKVDVTGNVSVTKIFTIAPGGELECDGNMTLSSGGYTFNNSGTIDCNGTFNATGGSITQDANGNIEVSGSVTSFGTLNNDAGTVTYDGGTQNVLADAYFNLVIDQSGTKTAQGTVTVADAMTVQSSATYALATTTTTVTGATDINGTISTSTGTLDANGTFDATGGNVTFTGAGLLNLGAAVTSLGTLTEATGTVVYDGSSQNLLAETYYNLTINGSGTKTAQGTVSVSNNLTVSAGTYSIAGTTTSVTGISDLNGGLSIGTGTYNADGEFDAAGSITFSDAGTLVLSSTVTSMGSSLTNTVGTVKYDGTSAQDVVAPSSGGYYNLTIENASTKTATGNIDVNGALTTEAEASCVFDLSTYDLNVAGNLTVGQEGGLDASDAACAVTFDGNSTVTHAGSQAPPSSSNPVTQGFNPSVSTSDPAGWSQTTVADIGTGTPALTYKTNSTYPSGYNPTEGTRCIGFNSYSCGSGSQILLEKTSSFDASTASSVDVSFDLLMNDYYNNTDGVYVAYKTSSGGTWNYSSIYLINTSGDLWESKSFTIPSSAYVSTLYIGLLFESGYGYDVHLDNLIISMNSSASINPTFNEIVVNGGDVTLAQDVDVTTTLTLTSGDIITSSSNKLTIESSAASALTTGSASSMIVGPFDRKTNSTDDYLLPVGDGTNYRPVVITPSATTATTYTAEFKNTAHASISYDANGYNNTACTNSSELDHVANGCWWDIERTTSGSDCYVALNWDATCGVDTPDDIVLAHYNGSSWDKIGSTLTDNTGSGSATASAGRVKSDLFVGDFSPFNLGSGSGNNSLPIDLLSFHTECSHDIVDVNFSVVSQINNEKFLIERSTDALAWEVVGELPGVPGGNSNTQMDYLFTDNNPLANLSYYRLTQVDFDGKAKTFYPVSSSCGSTVGGLPVDVYPNPAWSDVTIEFELDQYQGDDVYYTITDATGKTVMSDYLELNKGFNKNTLDINKLPRGVYILRFNQTKDHITETRIVKR